MGKKTIFFQFFFCHGDIGKYFTCYFTKIKKNTHTHKFKQPVLAFPKIIWTVWLWIACMNEWIMTLNVCDFILMQNNFQVYARWTMQEGNAYNYIIWHHILNLKSEIRFPNFFFIILVCWECVVGQRYTLDEQN